MSQESTASKNLKQIMKKPLSVEANDAKCATAKLGTPKASNWGLHFSDFQNPVL
jgi:hypothetical protein